MRVYIVKGSAGQWEDSYEWVAYASNDKEKCEQVMNLCREQSIKFYDAMQSMRNESEDFLPNIDEDYNDEYENFIAKQRVEIEKIVTEDPMVCSYEEYVTYHITEMEVDVV